MVCETMTSAERVRAAIEGREVDRLPVAVPYLFLYQYDHWHELTGEQPWEVKAWLHAAPEEHVKRYREFSELVPFDICQPWTACGREERECIEYEQRSDGYFEHDTRSDTWKRIDDNFTFASEMQNEKRFVYDRKDIGERVKAATAAELLARGVADYKIAAAEAMADKFILSGGVVGTFYACVAHVGMMNLLTMVREEPALLRSLSERLLEQNVELIRCWAAAGGDAIYIDDALSTCDMIRVKDYEEFCLPGMREMVREIRRLGKKAILIYFGGIADRVEQICSLGADALMMETSMKNYRNDLSEIAEKVKGRMALFGNLDPIGLIEKGTDEGVREKIAEQAQIGRARCKGFITSTGSPITPDTPLSRVQDLAEWGKTA